MILAQDMLCFGWANLNIHATGPSDKVKIYWGCDGSGRRRAEGKEGVAVRGTEPKGS